MKHVMRILFLCIFVCQQQIICMDGNPLSLRGVLKGHPIPTRGIALDISCRAKQAEKKLKELDKEFEPIFKQLSFMAVDALDMHKMYNDRRMILLVEYQCTEKDIKTARPFWYCPPLDEKLYQELMDWSKILMK